MGGGGLVGAPAFIPRGHFQFVLLYRYQICGRPERPGILKSVFVRNCWIYSSSSDGAICFRQVSHCLFAVSLVSLARYGRIRV